MFGSLLGVKTGVNICSIHGERAGFRDGRSAEREGIRGKNRKPERKKNTDTGKYCISKNTHSEKQGRHR